MSYIYIYVCIYTYGDEIDGLIGGGVGGDVNVSTSNC
jgi:hypothetical protein